MITKNYIIASEVPLTGGVSDSKVNPYIPKAMRVLKAILPEALFTALTTLYNTTVEDDVTDWSATNTYAVDGLTLNVENGIVKMWESETINSDEEPTTANTTNWDEMELGTFLSGYIQPYLAHVVYVSYAVNSGVNPTHQGLQMINNEVAAQLTPEKLDSYLAYWQNETRVLKTSFLTYLSDQNETLDGVKYDSVDARRKRPSFNITPVGGGNRIVIDPLTL